MPTIIDGHNLLWAVQNLEDTPAVTDAALCRILDGYFGLKREAAEIIFDGPGPLNKSEFVNLKNIEVTFSGRATDCDNIIEDRILASTAPKRLTIVSTDRRLRNAAEAKKAISIKCEDFWDEVKKRLSKHKPGNEPPGKRKGLTESETELWLKVFGIEQQ
ncbi:MAG: NYN domain-containing protein [Sedimentisphaerales bacterium]|nr:NYN domain-containing protein [Sedimentisphaerales bacterium]